MHLRHAQLSCIFSGSLFYKFGVFVLFSILLHTGKDLYQTGHSGGLRVHQILFVSNMCLYFSEKTLGNCYGCINRDNEELGDMQKVGKLEV